MPSLEPRAATLEDVPDILRMIRELAEYERCLSEAKATEEQLAAALFPSDGGSPAVFAHVVDAPLHSSSTTGEALAAREGTLAGFALWFLNFSTWVGVHGVYLEDLYVRPRYRKHGIGSALMKAIARVCVERGYGRFEWSVLDWNQPAIDFYRSLGAEPMSEWTVHRLSGEALQDLGRRLPVTEVDAGDVGPSGEPR